MPLTFKACALLAAFFAAFIIATQAFAQSSRQGINDDYTAPDMNTEDLVNRFEVEGREVFDRRNDIVNALNLKSGQSVADVGAGTGLFVPLLAEAVGSKGKVYAVDIIPKFIEHINQRIQQAGLTQVQTVLNSERSVELPDSSVDMIFTSDTYHHFVYYKEMLASIHSALKKHGEFVLVEFDITQDGIPDFMKDHVGNTPDQLTQQITDAGFELVEDFTLPNMKSTFMRRFKKVQH